MFGFVRGVTCADCRHVVARADAQRVERFQHVGDCGLPFSGWVEDRWYCPEHRKPFDVIDERWEYSRGHLEGAYVPHYFLWYAEVSGNGVPLKDWRGNAFPAVAEPASASGKVSPALTEPTSTREATTSIVEFS